MVLAFWISSMAAWPWAVASAAAEGPAATIKRDFDACRAHANIDACYDALRWKPSDPQLLVALGDAQMRAHRTADAIRTYKRAAQISPDMASLSAKISAAEARPAKRAPPIAAHADPGKRFSNAAPEAQSH
jgi:cytochrome c-type biogenesis protein CcmH/NrfG